MILRAVLCGCGAMAKGWLKAIAADRELQSAIRIVGLVDVNPEAARALAAEFEIEDAVIGSDLDSVLTEAAPDILFDIVVPTARRDVVATALRHGCHVLSEKPMASSLEAGRELIELARNAGRIHAIVQNRRFISGIRRIRRFIESGAIGDLTSIHWRLLHRRRISVVFAKRWEHVLLLDSGDPHLRCRPRSSPTRRRSPYNCHEENPQGLLVRARRGGHRDIRAFGRCDLHLSRFLVCRRGQYELGKRVRIIAPRARCFGMAPRR